MKYSRQTPNRETGGEQNKETILTLLGDQTCRRILCATSEEPHSASELETLCDASLSSIYRKIDDLNTASLLDERRRITGRSKHTREYVSRVDNITVAFSPDGTVDVSIDRTKPDRNQQAGRQHSRLLEGSGETSGSVSGQQSPISAQDD